MNTDAMNDAAIVVHTTVAGQEAADRLARLLVEQRLAACVQIVPGICSVYRWQGKLQRDDELQVAIKSMASKFDAIAALLREHHPYALPEIVAVRVALGSEEYLAWIASETSPLAREKTDR